MRWPAQAILFFVNREYLLAMNETPRSVAPCPFRSLAFANKDFTEPVSLDKPSLSRGEGEGAARVFSAGPGPTRRGPARALAGGPD